MLLNTIKLVGFKSFVDASLVHFPSALVGIVGPNGCGKSNIIDAVRWVMGESTASRLRGEQGSDVIFNGSSGRQPLGQAAVELIFDNSMASLGGEYARYTEISIRRVVTRSGVSSYFLNNTRCRRKDIADIFLGTGLGPRSYAIIQQGTVSRIIEAKPEELRQFLEEAAGISKYKERRKETEARIRGTRENLQRLQDIRTELEKQLTTLKRQATAAERFKTLKEEQRHMKAELLARRWKIVTTKAAGIQHELSARETEFQDTRAEKQQHHTTLEQIRLHYTQAADDFQAQQKIYYGVQNDRATTAQEIKQQQQQQQQQQRDLQGIQAQLQLLEQKVAQAQVEKIELQDTLCQRLPQWLETQKNSATTMAAQKKREEELSAWQHTWSNFRDQLAKASKTAEVEQTRLHQLDERVLHLTHKMQKSERALQEMTLSSITEKIAQLSERLVQERAIVQRAEQALHENKRVAQQQQQQLREVTQQLECQKKELQILEGKKVSLEMLQITALSAQGQATQSWLTTQGLQDSQYLVKNLQVESGWEHAVEVVLSGALQAICLESTTLLQHAPALLHLEKDTLTLMTPLMQRDTSRAITLLDKVQGTHLPGYLATIFAVESLEEALRQQPALLAHESIITPAGLWLGPNWARVLRHKTVAHGVVEREKELKKIIRELDSIEKKVQVQQQACTLLQQHYQAQQAHAELGQQQYQHAHAALTKITGDLSVQQRLHDQSCIRIEQLQHERAEQQQDLEQLQQQREQSRHIWSDALAALESLESKKRPLELQKEEKISAVGDIRQKNQELAHTLQVMTIEKNQLELELRSLEKNSLAIQQQSQSLEERKQKLLTQVATAHGLLDALNIQYQQLSHDYSIAEQAVQEKQKKMTDIRQQQCILEEQVHELEKKTHAMQAKIQPLYIELEGLRVRQQTLEEQLSPLEVPSATALLASITAEKTPEILEQQLAAMERRIERLGPINLVAIDECQEKEKRKQYYDEQYADVEQAVRALEDAMGKIDKETRTKFQATFEQVNATFQGLFPKIFGGGHASLVLTEADLLETGVEVIAQPPGKKNSSLHLLSGGEKTMIAIALVFSIFQLNPAPFCMLDEVDAPLDEANILRFCELVREMAQHLQFIVITHNKVTMAMMHHLMGVTMHEPGVSRLVSVDMQEAAALAR